MPYRHRKGNAKSVAGSVSSGQASFTQNSQSANDQISYRYLTGIVKEVISNPEELFNRKHYDYNTASVVKDDAGIEMTVRDVLSGEKSSDLIMLENNHFIDHLPMNSIIAHVTDDNATSSSNKKDVLCFPFFPPHLSLPIKPGEYVWLIKEDVRDVDVYYWICRKVGIRQLDDINITHLERHDKLVDIFERYRRKGTKIDPENVNMLANFYSNENTNLGEGGSFDEIAAMSVAFNEEFTGEPVPRQTKDCADLLIQGSNNAHISLGTEKFYKQYIENQNTAQGNNSIPLSPTPRELFTGRTSDNVLDERKPFAPAIDICIGRKKSDLAILATKSLTNTNPLLSNVNFQAKGNDIDVLSGKRKNVANENLEFFEIDKSKEVQGIPQNLNEFTDKDPTNCLARLYMSNNKSIDPIFGINSTIGDEASAQPSDIQGINDHSCLVAYSANTRIVGRETVKMNGPGGSMISFTHAGNIILQNASGAKIVLDSTGDIRIVPGSDGKIYLGGEKDETSIQPVGTGGSVTIDPGGAEAAEIGFDAIDGIGNIVTSAAGLIVEPAGSGRLSRKVRMK